MISDYIHHDSHLIRNFARDGGGGKGRGAYTRDSEGSVSLGGAIPGQWDGRGLIAECFMGWGRGLIPKIKTAWGRGGLNQGFRGECIIGWGHTRAVG